ncbi:MAG: DNA ligase-associated DEXH box helicase [Rhodospirillales bacterium]|jgi:ATP-dependent Lhr-like helicase|uniref:ligase-associated DNA damage response DEXH box helicase n=1 Tax=Hwanghaeella sp. 1Z406 TaxID=3402811 RepID=UPI000C92A9F9|nr:DNA ligase-associated DEXH box helicase [Rhodospirillales bacterium]|tara:strand:+ start:3437 stop:5884 length:2448 start_codon:yes stop_codon:yes gene_type:complete
MTEIDPVLPKKFSDWFQQKGWRPHPHQLDMVAADGRGAHTLLVAPTGGGKTLAGFLPSLIDLASNPTEGLHTLYISPLKALAVDIQRNLMTPVEEMGLDIRIETRTGDTPANRRQRQKENPPQILLTTPESLGLLISQPESFTLFKSLHRVILDEVHAIAGTKRGDQLALCLARLSKIAPDLRRVGLSATVAWPDDLRRYISPCADADEVVTVTGMGAKRADVRLLETAVRLPWSGHYGLHAIPEIYQEIKKTGTAIIFVNTRAQAELVFQELWRANEDALPIALHHGSLARDQRRKVEAAMADGSLRAVVATSSLDLGIDWAAVDLVVQVGPPKGVSRMIQRIGRAGHRLDVPSRALLVPCNRFEVLECRCVIEGVAEGTLDGDPPRDGGLDVLCQHIMSLACAAPFRADDIFAEIRQAAPYRTLTRDAFDAALRFVEDGGYALKSYDRWKRLFLTAAGTYEVANPRLAHRHRMNIGTIVEAVTLKVRLRGGGVLGEIEEYFATGLEPGDTFVFAGRMLRFEGIKQTAVEVSVARGKDPKVPAYMGGRLPFTTLLSDRVRATLADPTSWVELPDQVREWLNLQQWRSLLPGRDGLLVETFPRAGKEYLVAYSFAGRNAHQTLGMLLTKRMERLGLAPLGFVASDYVIAVWGLHAAKDMQALFDEDMLGDDLEAWMEESSLMKRTFRNVAVIAGLIERRQPGQEKTGRQVTFNSDLIYDVLRRHEPDHVLLQATRADAKGGMIDVGRLAEFLARVKSGGIRHRRLDRVSPLAVPILLEIGKEAVYGDAEDQLFDELAEELIEEAMRMDPQGGLPL